MFLYIANTIIYRGQERAVDAGVPDLFTGYFGTQQATLEAPFTGVFIAPNAPVQLQNGETCRTLFRELRYLLRHHVHRQLHGGDSAHRVRLEPSSRVSATTRWLWPGKRERQPRRRRKRGRRRTTGLFGPISVTTTAAPAVLLHVTLDKNGVSQGDTSGNTVTANPASPVPFTLPASIEVAGEIANGTAVLTFTNPSGAQVTCTFQGQAPVSNPTARLDLEAGRLLQWTSCTDGLPVTAQRFGTHFSFTVNPVPGWPVSVNLPLDDRSCAQSFPLITGLETRSLHDSFNWNAVKKVDATNPDGTPTLYYAWVYLHDDNDLLNLKKMYVHILSRPLFEQELEQFGGKCGTFTNTGDGVGAMVPVLMPGTVYNALVDVLTAPNISGNRQIIDAVILRNGEVPAGARNANGSVSLDVLRRSGFQYLGYEAQPLPSQANITLKGGAVSTLIDAAAFVLDAVKAVGQVITNAIGSLDGVFAGRVSFNVRLRALNLNGNFNSLKSMTRAWGPKAGSDLGAGGLSVTLMEATLGGFLPETFIADTDDNGDVFVRPAQHDGTFVRGSGICIQMSNDSARLNGFLMANDLCDFSAYPVPQGQPVPAQTAPKPFRITSFNSDQDFELRIADPGLSMMYQSDDVYRYDSDVIGKTVTTAHILTGTWADVVTATNSQKPFTMCFHLRNSNGNTLAQLLGGWYATLGLPNIVDVISATFGPLANNDIIMPDKLVWRYREVASHEYGHYTLCNYPHEEDIRAIDKLIINTLNSSGNSLAYPTRYINEAFADLISGQVASIANYGWVNSNQPENNKVCAITAQMGVRH